MKNKQTRAFVHSFRLVKIFALVAVCIAPTTAWSEWVTSGTDARLAMYMPQARTPNTYSILIVAYRKSFIFGCQPEVSTVVLRGRKLGSFVKQGTASDRDDMLVISVDGRSFTARTKINIYTNGIEKVMSAPNGLIAAMSAHPKYLFALIDNGLGFDFSGQPGFNEANRAALANCKQ